MKLVILAGGRGTRLGLVDRPKPMAPVGGRPLIERQVEVAAAAGFHDVVLLTGHMAEVIDAHFGDGSRFGVRITHVREDAPLGTAGAVLAARAHLAEPFVLVYGDLLFDVDLAHLLAEHRASGAVATLMVHPNDHPFDSDLVETDGAGRVTRLLAKPHSRDANLPNLVNAAIYALDPAAIDFVPDGASDWAHDIFPRMIAAGAALHAYRSIEYAKDVGTPDRLARGEADLAAGKLERLSRRKPKPALFLDRDGVLNADPGGVHAPDQLVLLPGVAGAVRQANRAGVPAICVTNQPDLAKGFFTRDALAQVHAALDSRLGEGGAWLDDLLFCPHHPERGFAGEVPELKIDCDCRKPKPGLLIDAARRHNLDLARSWLVGDRYCDIAAAHAAGARAVLVRTGEAGSDRARFPTEEPDLTCATLDEAVRAVLESVR